MSKVKTAQREKRMTHPRRKHQFMIGVLTTSIMVCAVGQSAIATCSDKLQVSASACHCCEKASSTAGKHHSCCRQKTPSNCSGQCGCHPKLPPANIPLQNESEKTGRENLIAVQCPIAPELKILHCCNPHRGELTGISRSSSVPLNLSLCVWLT